RPRVDQSFPNLTISSRPISLSKNIAWTPSLTYSASQSLHIDQPGEFQYRFFTNASGARDSVETKKSSFVNALSITSPVKIFTHEVGAAFRVNSQKNK